MSSEQTFALPPGRFPLRKAFNELRSRWEVIGEIAEGNFCELAECSFASTPLVTHGAWRGHTFASASMHHFFKQHVHPFYDDLYTYSTQAGHTRARTRGRKSKRTAYVINMLARLRELHAKIKGSSDRSLDLLPEWDAIM